MSERPQVNLAEWKPNLDLSQFVTLPKVQTVVSTDASTNKSILLLAGGLALAGILIAIVAKS